ncbi:hypothetical protein DYB32_009167 [Aphanomyces invadans]|uniref:Uncharacterized protein n=1 Tax=Aphanomyces invadans TaxID=157072 RepID=A0A3R6VR00_9STRA|nr:hypothetical protein DYB32_009167 [Aphanomyces invadans]
MANITPTLKLNDHNFRKWGIYFRGKVMMKGMHQYLTHTPTSATLDANSDDQKAFGILIDTLEPSQYRHIEGYTRVRIAYKALRLSDVRATETESNQVLKLLALMPWEFCHIVDRLSNLPDSEQTVAKTKIALEAELKAAVRSGAIKTPRGQANEDRSLFVAGPRERRPNSKGHRSDGKEHSNAAVFMCSATESGVDMIDLHRGESDDETKDDDGQPIQDAAEDNGPIFLGKTGEALPLRTDPDWHPTVQPVRQLFINNSPSPTRDPERRLHHSCRNSAVVNPTLLGPKYNIRAIECRSREVDDSP